MDRQVQQFVTIRFGALWVDVPIGPIVTSLSESWKTTAAPPAAPDQEEVTSPPMEGFTPVLSKSAKRKMRAARKNAAQGSAKGVVTQIAAKSTPVSALKGKNVEMGQSSRELSKGKGKTVVFEKSEFPPLVYKGKERIVEKPCRKLHGKRGDAAVILPSASSSTGRPTNGRNILRVDAPEFIPSLAHKSSGERSAVMQNRSLEWKGVCLTSRDLKTGHVDPTSVVSDPLSEKSPIVQKSFEGSFDPVRHQRRQRDSRHSWVDLPAVVDQAAASQHRAHVSKSVKGRWKNTRPKMRVQNPNDSYVVKCICQTLRSNLPGASTSQNDEGGAIMRQAEALARLPEYEEFIQQYPERQEYVTQAARVRSRRAALKEREQAVRARSGSSGVQGTEPSSSVHTSQVKVSKWLSNPSNKVATSLSPWPSRRRTKSGSFEVFSAMPVGVRTVGDNTSETSSTSTHFKRKKARKTVEGPRRMTRSQKGSDNEELGSSYGGSYNPLSDSTPCPSENETDTHMDQHFNNSADYRELVLAANETRSAEEELAILRATLQQKDDEIVALRGQMNNNANKGTEENGGASTSSQQGGAALNLEAIQRMIAEGVKTQLMQNHYSMRPGYVKPYPPDVDLVPFPGNYRQPQFSKFNGSGSPHEHIAHFLAACQDTAHNGALLLRQFVQTLSGPAFTWYSKLAPSSIKTWEQMQNAFLERFYSTQRIVGITELTQTEQGINEKAADFINRWRNLSLHCSQLISEPEAVRMCTNNLRSDVAVQLQGVRPITFEDLASKATDIENYMSLMARRTKMTFNKPVERSGQRERPPSKPKSAQAMETTAVSSHLHSGRVAPRNHEQGDTQASRRPTLSERQNRVYSFPVEEINDLFTGLKELSLIELPTPKRPGEASKINEPNFCHYHRILGHTLKDCFVVKNIIQKMIDEGTIDADLLKSMTKGKKMAAANVATLQDDSALPKRKISIKERLTFPAMMAHGPAYQVPEEPKIGSNSGQNAVYYPQ